MPRSAMTTDDLIAHVTRQFEVANGTAALDTAASAAWLRALAAVCREQLAHRWSETQRQDFADKARRINYLSMEFLMGRALGNALDALDLSASAREGVGGEHSLTDLFENESDAALGNGGLGRLAACFLDSMATLGMPCLRLRIALSVRHVRAGHS